MNDINIIKRLKYNILLLGDSECGKTSMLQRFINGTYSDYGYYSIGTETMVKKITLQNGETIQVKFYDTNGQERYRSINRNYYKLAQGFILVYDSTKRRTFDNIRYYLENIIDEVNINEKHIFLVGNKIDLTNDNYYTEGNIPREDIEHLANNWNLRFYEVSAKEGTNINNCFNDLIELIYQEEFNRYENELIKLQKRRIPKRGCIK